MFVLDFPEALSAHQSHCKSCSKVKLTKEKVGASNAKQRQPSLARCTKHIARHGGSNQKLIDFFLATLLQVDKDLCIDVQGVAQHCATISASYVQSPGLPGLPSAEGQLRLIRYLFTPFMAFFLRPLLLGRGSLPLDLWPRALGRAETKAKRYKTETVPALQQQGSFHAWTTLEVQSTLIIRASRNPLTT